MVANAARPLTNAEKRRLVNDLAEGANGVDQTRWVRCRLRKGERARLIQFGEDGWFLTDEGRVLLLSCGKISAVAR